ncbi:MAG: hypothetical protein U5L05_05075 [Rubrivivax sp.]|nr:hypothetical protein [Rubrivivax sp.]
MLNRVSATTSLEYRFVFAKVSLWLRHAARTPRGGGELKIIASILDSAWIRKGLECIHSYVPAELMALLEGVVLAGVAVWALLNCAGGLWAAWWLVMEERTGD